VLTRGLDTQYAAPATVEALWRGISVPVAVSLVFVYAVVAVLGWWRPVLVDHRPVRRWVRILALWSSVIFGLAHLADIVLLIIVLVRRHQVEPEPAPA
jgi:hypothetical protein